MDPQVKMLLKIAAVGIQVQANGLTDELRTELVALSAEAKDSILEPQDDGTPWTDAAILNWKAEHDALMGEMRARHGGAPPAQG